MIELLTPTMLAFEVLIRTFNKLNVDFLPQFDGFELADKPTFIAGYTISDSMLEEPASETIEKIATSLSAQIIDSGLKKCAPLPLPPARNDTLAELVSDRQKNFSLCLMRTPDPISRRILTRFEVGLA